MLCFNNLFSIQPNLELAIEGCLVADHPQCISTKLSASLVCLVFCYFFDVVTVSLLGLLCTHMTAATVSKFLLVLHSKKDTYLVTHCGTTFTFTFTAPMSVAAPKIFPLFWQHLDFTSVQDCWITFHHFYDDVCLLFIFWCWFIWQLILTKSSFCPSAGVLTCHKVKNVTVVVLWYRTQNVFSQVGTPSPCVYLSQGG